MATSLLLLAFRVDTQPHAKGRPRWSEKNRKTYTPTATKVYEKLVSACATQAAFSSVNGSILPIDEGVPLEVITTFYLHRPKRLMRKTDPDGPIAHTRRPDIDNLVKSVLDGIDRSGMVWHDDAQVCHTQSYKYYHGKKEKPHVLVQICRVEGDG